jgi:hypothetical protein
MTFAGSYHFAVLALLSARIAEPDVTLAVFLGKHRRLIEDMSAKWLQGEKSDGLPSPVDVIGMLIC